MAVDERSRESTEDGGQVAEVHEVLLGMLSHAGKELGEDLESVVVVLPSIPQENEFSC